jgi:hypothetical protein
LDKITFIKSAAGIRAGQNCFLLPKKFKAPSRKNWLIFKIFRPRGIWYDDIETWDPISLIKPNLAQPRRGFIVLSDVIEDTS